MRPSRCPWLALRGGRRCPVRPQLALFPADLVAWVQATQPKAWEALAKNHGTAAEATLLDRVRKQLDDRGTLDVLRHGIEMLGCASPLRWPSSSPRWR